MERKDGAERSAGSNTKTGIESEEINSSNDRNESKKTNTLKFQDNK